MTRWLVTGAGGQLGTDLVRVLRDAAADVVALDRSRLDVTDPGAVTSALETARPTIVVNCAAYTAVDAAETDEATAMRVNADGPRHLAAGCAALGARLIHLSTDYVFAGAASAPYDVDEPTDPRSAYGRSKAAGERAVLETAGDHHVVRTAWVYGATGANFVKTIVRLAGERETLSVVDDQRGSPTWSGDLAHGVAALGVADVAPGIWHCTGTGDTTWYGFATAVFEELGLDPGRISPASTADFPRPAPRPAYSVLSLRKWLKAGLPAPMDWRAALPAALAADRPAYTGRG